MPSSASADPRLLRLIGVYAADGTLTGEIAYWVGARLGRAHCSLCDVTHGLFRAKGEWAACVAGLPVPFDTYHRNDQPDSVRRIAADVTPIVAAETTDGAVMLLGPAEIGACAGSPERLMAAIEAAVSAKALAWA